VRILAIMYAKRSRDKTAALVGSGQEGCGADGGRTDDEIVTYEIWSVAKMRLWERCGR
jgi:hypothetical protein